MFGGQKARSDVGTAFIFLAKSKTHGAGVSRQDNKGDPAKEE
jgi:hypothetical protein